MNFAEVQIDNKVIKYIFIEASTFYDIRESDFLTFYSCGLDLLVIGNFIIYK